MEAFLNRERALRDVQANLSGAKLTKKVRYLLKVEEEILREYNAFMGQIIETGSSTSPLIVDKEYIGEKNLNILIRGFEKVEQVNVGGTKEIVVQHGVGELQDHIILFRNNVYLARSTDLGAAVMLFLVERWAGQVLPHSQKTVQTVARLAVERKQTGTERPEILFDFGYIGSYINQYSACETHLQSNELHPLLDSIADPLRREKVSYRAYQHIVPIGDTATVPINKHQLKALKSLSYNIEGIQGPPGTGKSTVIYHITRSFLPHGSAVLATCVQNKAVDAIASKFAVTSKELPFIVYGREDRLGLVGMEWTLEAQVDRNPDVVHMRDLLTLDERAHKEELRRKEDYERTNPESHDFDVTKLNELTERLKATKTRFEALWNSTAATIVENARAVLCTVATASRSFLADEMLQPLRDRINCAILDEAGTCSEANLPLLALLPHLDRIIAIGDHNQLAPFTNINPKATGFRGRGGRGGRGGGGRGGGGPQAAVQLPRGFFKRIADTLPKGSISMLCLQYRMHPNISKYISSTFYKGQLQTPDPIAQARTAVCHHGMWFIPTVSLEEKKEGSSSTLNSGEANMVHETLKVVTGGRVDVARLKKTIMIITFYKAQEVYIRELLNTAGYQEHPEYLRILSVDQAQGSEADVVILSCVRSNPAGRLGFTSNPNRLNVAISRARDQIVVIGNPSTLVVDKNWKRLIKDACMSIDHAGLIGTATAICSTTASSHPPASASTGAAATSRGRRKKSKNGKSKTSTGSVGAAAHPHTNQGHHRQVTTAYGRSKKKAKSASGRTVKVTPKNPFR